MKKIEEIKNVAIYGEPEYIAHIIDCLELVNIKNIYYITEGYSGRNFLIDLFKKKQQERLIQKPYKHFTTRNFKEQELNTIDVLFVCTKNSQKRTDWAITGLEYGLSKNDIVIADCESCRAGIHIFNQLGEWNDVCCMSLNNYKPQLRYIEYHVTDFCNLKCKGCGHKSETVKDLRFADIDDFEVSIKKLSCLFENIDIIRLMGGEPLLCKELYKYIDIVHKYFPYSNLKIVTNGLLYKNISFKTIESMKNSKAKLHISLYPPTRDIIDELIMFCRENSIRFTIFRMVEQFWRMVDSGNNASMKTRWKECYSKTCHFLYGKRFYPCTEMWVKWHFRDKIGEKGSITKADRDKYSYNLEDKIEYDGWDIIRRIENPFEICMKCGDKKEFFNWERSYK